MHVSGCQLSVNVADEGIIQGCHGMNLGFHTVIHGIFPFLRCAFFHTIFFFTVVKQALFQFRGHIFRAEVLRSKRKFNIQFFVSLIQADGVGNLTDKVFA